MLTIRFSPLYQSQPLRLQTHHDDRPGGDTGKSLGAEHFGCQARRSMAFAEPHSWWSPRLPIRYQKNPHSKALKCSRRSANKRSVKLKPLHSTEVSWRPQKIPIDQQILPRNHGGFFAGHKGDGRGDLFWFDRSSRRPYPLLRAFNSSSEIPWG